MKTRFIILTGLFLLNLSVNAQPVAYNVTGGGSYCQGSAGSQVGLSGSEEGVTYTLFKDDIEQALTIPGTGDAISFGSRLYGTYTISGTNADGTTSMNGNAVVIENVLPVVTFIVQPGANTCQGIEVVYTTETSMTDYLWIFTGTQNIDYIIVSGGTGTSNSVTMKYLKTGSMTVSINYTNSTGCTAFTSTSSIVTTVNPLPASSPIYHH